MKNSKGEQMVDDFSSYPSERTGGLFANNSTPYLHNRDEIENDSETGTSMAQLIMQNQQHQYQKTAANLSLPQIDEVHDAPVSSTSP